MVRKNTAARTTYSKIQVSGRGETAARSAGFVRRMSKGRNMSEIQFVKKIKARNTAEIRIRRELPRRKSSGKKRWKKWSVLIVVLIVAVVAAGAAEIYLLSNTVNYGKDEPYIGVLFVEGTIQSSSLRPAAGERISMTG